MAKLSLRGRLLVSHLVVMVVGILTMVVVGRLFSPRLFIITLERYQQGVISVQRRTQLVRGFEAAWSRGMLWAILSGGGAAGGLSYLLSRRIIRPLDQMEEVTRQFAAGHLSERVPPSEILEIQRLASSFNRMAADLEGVEQRRRELIGDLTHELRTPLTIIQGYLEGLADGTIPPEPELYQRLADEATRLQRLVNDLQELSKLEAGYLPIQAEAFALEPLLSTLIDHFNEQFVSQTTVAVWLDCPPHLPMVYADASRVEQIMINLLSNALRHTPEGKVMVRAWEEPGRVYVQVEDTGTGIAPEHLPYIFERFWRGEPSRNRRLGGTGIGLTICRRLVEIQGGEITVRSKLGEGSAFTFWLPQPQR
jgi:signal transduction histidine kinase